MTVDPDSHAEELLRRAARGDQAAIGLLLAEYRPRLRQMVVVRMPPQLKPRLDPSDVVQEALMEAARLLPQYLRERPLPYYPWLRQLAWQRLYDLHVQHQQAKKRSVLREDPHGMALSDESVVQLAQQLASPGTSPSRHAIRKELQERVRQALEQLEPGDRELLILKYLEQLSTREIATILQIGEGTVRIRHLRALERLRGLLGGEGEDFR